MADGTVSYTSTRITFLQLLTVLFVALKLTHVVAWSWYLVLLPLWGPVALILTIVLAVVVIAGIGVAITHFLR